jgi:hypothetical protein
MTTFCLTKRILTRSKKYNTNKFYNEFRFYCEVFASDLKPFFKPKEIKSFQTSKKRLNFNQNSPLMINNMVKI